MKRITCITPTTAARRWCLPLAIRWFQEQTYEDREMVIVFSGPGTVRDLIPDDDCIRLIELEGEPSLGDKHNVACFEARGEWLAKWDDDDYHPTEHLEHMLVCAQPTPEAELVGRSCVILHELIGERRTFEYDGLHTPRLWLAGNSMIFRKTLWQRQPFPNLASGVDTVFIWNVLEKSQLIVDKPFRYEYDNAVILGSTGGTVVMEYGQGVGRKNWNPGPPEYIRWPHRPNHAPIEQYERAFKERT